jgi:hypothetical protein
VEGEGRRERSGADGSQRGESAAHAAGGGHTRCGGRGRGVARTAHSAEKRLHMPRRRAHSARRERAHKAQ